MNKTQGRRICDVLKEIRNKVAKEGNLELNQKECTYRGECSGTCPACEAELKKINETFNHKKLLAMAGCATMILPMTGCTNSRNQVDDIQGDIEIDDSILIAEDECETPVYTKDELPDDLIAGKIVPKPIDVEVSDDIEEDIDVPITAGVLPPQEYVFSEDEEDEFPQGITTLEELEVAENVKKLIREDFPKNHLRGVINPNAKFH